MKNMQKKLTVFLVAMVTCSRSPSENGSVISNQSGKPNSSRGSPQKVMAQQKVTKEEGRKRNGEKCFLMPDLLYSMPTIYPMEICHGRQSYIAVAPFKKKQKPSV